MNTLISFVCALHVALDLGPLAFATLEIDDKKMNFDGLLQKLSSSFIFFLLRYKQTSKRRYFLTELPELTLPLPNLCWFLLVLLLAT